jgi:two-component system, chemotaxis family, sensor kinase Cph1
MPGPQPDSPAAPRSDSELSEFLLRACHDLRGPLRAVRAHAALLAKKSDDSEKSLAFLVDGAEQASAVVDGIADYALALAIDPSRFLPTPLDVLVRTALAKLSRKVRENHAEVVYDDLPSVPGDADRLLQLFEYLLDHALRHGAPNRKSIHISAERQNGTWLFTMRVSGDGMAPEPVEGAFTPFARLSVNQRPGPGLATCRSIVERHGGRMWAESAAGAGLVVRFTLPY